MTDTTPEQGHGLSEAEREVVCICAEQLALDPGLTDAQVMRVCDEHTAAVERILAARADQAAAADDGLRAACRTCAHPEGYDRLSGPCPTCHGTGIDATPAPVAHSGHATPDGNNETRATPAPAYEWKRNDQADHEAGHSSGYDCDGYALGSSEACGHRFATSAPADLDAVRFTAGEVIALANETSDTFGNLYRLDFIDRIRHEARADVVARPEGGAS